MLATRPGPGGEPPKIWRFYTREVMVRIGIELPLKLGQGLNGNLCVGGIGIGLRAVQTVDPVVLCHQGTQPKFVTKRGKVQLSLLESVQAMAESALHFRI